ncbi:sensor histidine kinase [Thermodesulfobacteriota bacterium]
MILIDFVMISTAKRNLLQSEISKASIIISAIEKNFINFYPIENTILPYDFKYGFTEIVNEAGFSCALVIDNVSDGSYLFGKSCGLSGGLESLVRETIRSGKRMTQYSGSTWGVFGKQPKILILTKPLLENGIIIAGVGIAVKLDGIYRILRQTQYILFAYILLNTIVLTLAGFYQLSKVTVNPLQKLVKRAEEYQEDTGLFFTDLEESNEYNKLSKSLNRMLDRIAEDKGKLQTTIQSLKETNLELKQAQQNIIRAEKLASVGRLASGIAHEIGNPIGIVIGYLELLKQKGFADEEKNEFIIRAEDEVNRINTILRQLLDFSRLSEGKLQPISVHEIIEDIVQVIKLQPFMSDICLSLSLEAENDKIMADPDQLRQVFLNLMMNAADALSLINNNKNGKLSIGSRITQDPQATTEESAKLLKLMVIDNGPGIPEEILINIFDPFFTTKEPGKGTGLGLSVCFTIIEGIGGKMEAASQESEGTTVTIYLPLYSKS